jgi:SAM-dependent methyltransferase
MQLDFVSITVCLFFVLITEKKDKIRHRMISSSDSSKASVNVLSLTASSSSSKLGLFGALTIGALAIGGSALAVPFLLPALRRHALPYVPATNKQLDNVFKAIKIFNNTRNLASKQNPQKLIDLGSGDGRIVFEAVKRGYQATGVELNSVLVAYSKIKTLTHWQKMKKEAFNEGQSTIKLYRPIFRRADLWKVDMSQYDIIVVFGVQEMMSELAIKLKKEMQNETLIVSCRYPIEAYKSIYNLDDELDSVWIYDKSSLMKPSASDEPKEKLRVNKRKEDDDDDDD